MPDVTFTALLQPMHSSARSIRGEIPNRPDSTVAARRSSSVDSVFIPSAISSLPLGWDAYGYSSTQEIADPDKALSRWLKDGVRNHYVRKRVVVRLLGEIGTVK